jgi:hypothetical protein
MLFKLCGVGNPELVLGAVDDVDDVPLLAADCDGIGFKVSTRFLLNSGQNA